MKEPKAPPREKLGIIRFVTPQGRMLPRFGRGEEESRLEADPDQPSPPKGTGEDSAEVDGNAESGEDEARWAIEVEFAPRGGQLYPVAVTISPGPYAERVPGDGLTTTLLRSIRLGQLVDEFRAEQEGNRAAELLFFGRTRTSTLRPPPPMNRPGPRGLSEEFYQDVAVRYLQAVNEDPRRPLVRMLERYPQASRDNLRDWVARARGKGYLTPLASRRPGGQPTQKLLDAIRARGEKASG